MTAAVHGHSCCLAGTLPSVQLQVHLKSRGRDTSPTRSTTRRSRGATARLGESAGWSAPAAMTLGAGRRAAGSRRRARPTCARSGAPVCRYAAGARRASRQFARHRCRRTAGRRRRRRPRGRATPTAAIAACERLAAPAWSRRSPTCRRRRRSDRSSRRARRSPRARLAATRVLDRTPTRDAARRAGPAKSSRHVGVDVRGVLPEGAVAVPVPSSYAMPASVQISSSVALACSSRERAQTVVCRRDQRLGDLVDAVRRRQLGHGAPLVRSRRSCATA